QLLSHLGWSCRIPGTPSKPDEAKPHEAAAEDLPTETKQALAELDAEMEKLQWEKEEAIAEQDFERAAHLRDEGLQLHKKRKAIRRDWYLSYAIDPGWLSWKNGTVTKLAASILGERRWQDLPLLADALQKAGCGDEEILSHCRQAGDHADRCWVID